MPSIFEHVLVQPFEVCWHHDLAADDPELIRAVLFGHHSRRQLLANAAMAASSGTAKIAQPPGTTPRASV